MLNFNLRHLRDLACTYIDAVCPYPTLSSCHSCQLKGICVQYTYLSNEIQNSPFAIAEPAFVELARETVKWADGTYLATERGYLEAKQYLKEYGILGHC